MKGVCQAEREIGGDLTSQANQKTGPKVFKVTVHSGHKDRQGILVAELQPQNGQSWKTTVIFNCSVSDNTKDFTLNAAHDEKSEEAVKDLY